MTQATSSTSFHASTRNNRSVIERGADPPRRQAETNSAKERFASKLEREGQGEKSERKTANSQTAGASGDGRAIRERGQEHGSGSGGFEGFAQQGQSGNLQSVSTAQTSGTTAGADIDASALQRMAAQIAENWPSGSTQSVSIQLPEGMVAESAIIKREHDGSIAIRIAGLDPKLTARQNARVQLELVNALALRRLKVSSLKFGKSDADQRGLASAMPRAV